MKALARSMQSVAAILAALCVLFSVRVSSAQEATALFVVTGTVYQAGSPAADGLRVDVVNTATEDQKHAFTGEVGEGQYAATFIDMTENRAAAVGDRIEVAVADAEGTTLGSAARTLTSEDIAAATVTIDVQLPATAVVSSSWGYVKRQR